MPHDIDHNTAAQRRTSKLLAAMAIFICLGIVAYIILTLLVNRQTPANPDTHYTGTNGVSVYYDSSIWKVCQMTEDSTLGTVLELATADIGRRRGGLSGRAAAARHRRHLPGLHRRF